MAYIIDSYNKHSEWDRSHTVETFYLNGMQYGIKEVDMVWGLPALQFHVGEKEMPESYYIYEQLKDAQSYVKMLKSLNRR